jgi:hypothetical protein
MLKEYENGAQDDFTLILYKIIADHEGFTIFNIIDNFTIECKYKQLINDDYIPSLQPILFLETREDTTLSLLVEKNNREQIVGGTSNRCSKSADSFEDNGPYITIHNFSFPETVYLIIYLKRFDDNGEVYKQLLDIKITEELKAKYGEDYMDHFESAETKKFIEVITKKFAKNFKTRMTHYNIQLDYKLNINGTNFILEGIIVKSGEINGGHYIYVKILSESKYRVHDDEKYPVDKNGNYNLNHSYRKQALLLLYKKVT